MKITIEIELADVDHPLFSARVNHALSGLLHEAHQRDISGEYVFTYPAVDFYSTPPTVTTVRVTQEDLL